MSSELLPLPIFRTKYLHHPCWCYCLSLLGNVTYVVIMLGTFPPLKLGVGDEHCLQASWTWLVSKVRFFKNDFPFFCLLFFYMISVSIWFYVFLLLVLFSCSCFNPIMLNASIGIKNSQVFFIVWLQVAVKWVVFLLFIYLVVICVFT